MAKKGEAIGSLFLNLGLDMTALEASYVDADKTVMENQRKLQRIVDNNKMKLKLETDSTSTEGINRQLAIINDTLKAQKDQIKIAEAEYKKCFREAGEGAASTQKALKALQRLQMGYNTSLQQQRRLEANAVKASTDKIAQQMNLIRAQQELIKSNPALSEEEKRRRSIEQTNKLIDLQRKKVEELNEAYRKQAAKTGANSSEAMALQTSALRAGATLNNMQSNHTAELAAMAAMNRPVNTAGIKQEMQAMARTISGMLEATVVGSMVAPVISALSSIKNVFPKINFSIKQQLKDFGDYVGTKFPALMGAGSRSVGALGTALASIGRLAGPLAALTAVGAAIVMVGKSAADAGREIMGLSYRLNMTGKEAKEFKQATALAGADCDKMTEDLIGLNEELRTLPEEGSVASRMLEQFGVNLQDSEGNMKPYSEQLREIAEGYARAKEAGMGFEFLNKAIKAKDPGTFEFFDRYEQFMKTASQTQQAGFLDPEQANELKGAYNELGQQFDMLTEGVTQLFAVMATPLLEPLKELCADLVKTLSENKALWAGLAGIIGGTLKVAIEALDLMIKAMNKVYNIGNSIAEILVENLGPGFNYIGACAAEAGARIQALFKGWSADELNTELDKIHQKLENDNKFLKNMLYGKDEGEAPTQDLEKRKALMDEIYGKNVSKEKEAEEAHKKAMENMAEADRIYYHMNHTALENQIYDIEQSMQKQMEAAKSEEEAASIQKLAIAKIAEARKQASAEMEESHKKAMENLNQANDIYFRQTHNEYQNELRDIQQNAEAQAKLAKSSEEVGSVWTLAAAKVSDVWTKLVDKIKDMNRSLEDKIYALTHTEAETKRHELAKEAQNYLQQGADPALVEKYYNLQLAKAGGGNKEYGSMGHVIDLVEQSSQNSKDIMSIVSSIVDSNRQEARYGSNNNYSSMGHVIYLNVNISGLEDVEDRVAETAAKEIISRLPSGNQYNISYG